MSAGAKHAFERTRLQDVARSAGVSLATVDRVVNRRSGVREKTIRRVEEAMDQLGYRLDPMARRLARNQNFRFLFILPTGTNSFMMQLREQVERTAEWAISQRGFIDVIEVDVFDAEALAQMLDQLDATYQGVATVALDHPRVRVAIDDLAQRGIPVITLVSDVPYSRRLHYVGVDNPAAGRTAASLMGRFLNKQAGSIGILVGSLSLRDHAERHFGFNQVLAHDYPHLKMLPVVEGRDDLELSKTLVTALIDNTPDLIGLYSAGAGNRGIAQALTESGKADQVVWIGHELTPHTRRFLFQGTMDAVINQDSGHEVRSAARLLLAHCWGEAVLEDQERIRIDIFIKDNIP
ncbi:MAG: LacI family DNA-binding transcriptional regulator [Beijerinckiaceae bacterium]